MSQTYSSGISSSATLTFFDKVQAFRIPYVEEKELLNKVAIHNFGSFCAEHDKPIDIKAKTWIETLFFALQN